MGNRKVSQIPKTALVNGLSCHPPRAAGCFCVFPLEIYSSYSSPAPSVFPLFVQLSGSTEVSEFPVTSLSPMGSDPAEK